MDLSAREKTILKALAEFGPLEGWLDVERRAVVLRLVERGLAEPRRSRRGWIEWRITNQGRRILSR